MSTKFLLPNATETMSIFGMLYGDNVSVDKTDKVIGVEESKLTGLFVDADGQPVAACMCDTPFAAYAGAAMTMLPPGGAQDAVEEDDISQTMKDNVYEVMNICSRLMMSDDTPHLKLENMYDRSELSEEALAMIEKAEGHKEFGVSFNNYGSGHISFVTS